MPHKKLTIAEMHKMAEEIGGWCLSEHYVNAKTKLQWQCEFGHTWWTTPAIVRRGSWCPKCAIEFRKIHTAMNLPKLSRMLQNTGPEATLPAALADVWLDAAIHDLRQYFLYDEYEDNRGDLYLSGPMMLLRQLLIEKGISVPMESLIDFLNCYMLELEIEQLMRLDASFKVERATLQTILEPERWSLIDSAMESGDGFGVTEEERLDWLGGSASLDDIVPPLLRDRLYFVR